MSTIRANNIQGLDAPNPAIELPIDGTVILASGFSGDLESKGTFIASGLTVDSTATFAVGASGTPAIAASGDANTGIYFPAADTIGFAEGGNEAARIDDSGRVLIGTNTARRRFFNADGEIPTLQIEGTGVSTRGLHHLSLTTNNTSSNAGAGAFAVFGRSRGGAGDYTVVNGDDAIGSLSFQGADGTDLVEAARITAFVDGTAAANDMPGRLVFYTTADGASSPSERARFTRAGYLKASDIGDYTSTTSINHEFGQSLNSTTIFFRATNASYSSTIGTFRCSRAQTSDYNFIACQSNNGGDNEFLLKGDGNAVADGSWTGGGADYAEYFEWSDGNTSAEDRRGISVVLDGEKIREAVAGEDPIGVISGNPSVVGDAAWNKWNGKYLRDDFGSYIRNEEGERQLNPDYDPNVEYIPRENRPEWDCVGLMGKLRIRKGQVTGARWIKMRDISDTVEEWLVR